MNKATIKAFIAWLEAASEAAIRAHQQEVLAHLAKITSREGRADVRLALRLIDEELLARMEACRQGS